MKPVSYMPQKRSSFLVVEIVPVPVNVPTETRATTFKKWTLTQAAVPLLSVAPTTPTQKRDHTANTTFRAHSSRMGDGTPPNLLSAAYTGVVILAKQANPFTVTGVVAL